MWIILKPDLIIAVVPTLALDVVRQRHVMETLKDIQFRNRSRLILVGHAMGLMAQTVDELAVLKLGELIEHRLVKKIIEVPKHSYMQDLIQSVLLVGGKSF
jgi:ABC-type dipeptide/oligopeptide/nickel transport system ATPase component